MAITRFRDDQMSGEVQGPASSTDHAIVRFDGTTGKLVQNSANVTVTDTGRIKASSGNDLYLEGGDATNNKGASIQVGDGDDVNATTGDITLSAGDIHASEGTTRAGIVFLTPGRALNGGTDGWVVINEPSGAGTVGLKLSNITGSRNIEFPDASGTFELEGHTHTELEISDLDHYTDTDANSAIDTRVNKAFVDALNVDADTLDGNDSTAFATSAHTHDTLANIATSTILGRTTAGSGNSEELTAAQVRTLINVEDGADVTDTANVTAAGALMDSEVDADIKTLSLPANTTISAFGATLVDDADAATARTTLDAAQATHTHTEGQISDLDHDADKIKGKTITITALTDGDALYYSSGSNLWYNDVAVNPSNTITLTNKTISGSQNTLTNIPSSALVEGFFRGRLQANTTNSAPTGQTVQYGWGFIQGDGTTTLLEGVTFPAAFSSAPVVLISFIGASATSGGTPTATSDFTTSWTSFRGLGTDDITTSGFNVRMYATSAHSSSFYFGYAWIAIGPV